MNTSIRFPFLARAAGLALLIGVALPGGAVLASPRSDSASVTVQVADVDLRSPTGISVLYKRIHSAALQVCAGGEDRNLAVLSIDMACAAKTQAKAIAQMHNPALSAYARTKIGHSNRLLAMNDGK